MTRTIEVSDETYERIKTQLKEEEQTDISGYKDLEGKAWFFRTVTYHLVGNVVKVWGSWVTLKDASWIADSGRFMQFVKNGTPSEVEPVGTINVNMNTVTDFLEWKHKLPTEQK